MSRSTGMPPRWRAVVAVIAALAPAASLHAQEASAVQQGYVRQAAAQPNDSAYTARIHEYLSDPRISTELVDHLPASATVPTPLKFLGRIIGTPGELTRNEDINRYLQAIADAAPGRAKFWTIGKSEEGRDMVLLAVGDEEAIRNLDKYKTDLHALTDPRKTTEEQAQAIIHSSKPIYWITSGMHSPESGGPEMLMELAYRLVVEETPFIQDVRKGVITFITPVIQTDGRDKMVDTYYWNKKYGPSYGRTAAGGRGGGVLPLMYWGKYVQHDDNRDGMGQFLNLTKNTTKTFLEWTPTVLHDLHEAQTYLYASTGTGPYNDALDPITVDEWWQLAENDVMEMTKRGVPGVWTYGFYDGWVPNYLFFIAHTHNSIGRFYEVQSYGPDPYVVKPGATTTSKEWFRPNPPLDSINWGPRANTNIQESAILFALHRVAQDRQLYLDNYWLKNKRAVAKGTTGPVFAWVIPAGQHAKENVAEAVNELRTQGLEFQVATTAFTAGKVQVKPGDYIVRGDQPYRTIADMYFALQNFSPQNPAPYDDTGWTFPLMRDITVNEVTDRSILAQPMTFVKSDVVAAGGITGAGRTVLVENAADNALVSFRFEFPRVKMAAAEAGFDAAGHHFDAGSFIIANAPRAQLDTALRRLGLAAYAVSAAPTVATHDLDVPRIGYVHSWTRTQDEGWVRAALDYYHVPYDYFGEPMLKQGNLRAKYDVIVYPHGGSGLGGAGGRGGAATGGAGAAEDKPVPYKRTAEFPSLGYPDSTDDIRGAVGADGMKALYEFVQQGGTLITEGSTAQMLPDLGLTPGVTSESPRNLFVRGSILRGQISDAKSPLVYGYEHTDVPVYFNTGPVLNAGAGAQPVATAGSSGGPAANGRGGAEAQNTTPMASPLQLSGWDPDNTGVDFGVATSIGNDFNVASQQNAATARAGRGGGGGFGSAGFGGANAAPRGVPGLSADPNTSTRVVMQFPADAKDMLLSGTLEGGESLSKRALLVDESVGKGHVVMFAMRPFWRWQTQGTFAMGFNALMNWNDLSAGK